MKCYLKVVSLICLVAFSVNLRAQENEVVENNSLDCLLGTYSFVKFKHREHRGLGYDTGYSTLELFLTPSWEFQFQPIFNGRGHVFNNGDLAANLGIAGRIADQNENFAFGLNLFYDFRKRSNLKTSQASIGLEFLSNYLDLRVNGYLPVSGYATEVVDRTSTFGGFTDNTLLLNSTARFAFPSADAEIGGVIPTPFDNISIYVGTGPYYLFKQNARTISDGNAFGWRAVAEFNFTDWFDIGGEYTYDRIYNSRFVGFASINIPLGRRSQKNKSSCAKFAKGMAMKTQKLRRNEIIPMRKKKTQVSLEGVNIIFVDNTGVIGTGATLANGEGTYQSPYTNLVAVQDNSNPGDIIYIYPGDGTTRGYDTGLVLKSDQNFHSSSLPITIDGVFVPAQTQTMPKITNTTGVGIELANNTKVMGITVTNPKGHAVSGDSISGFDVQLCDLIATNNMNGIALDNLKGSFNFSENTLSSNSSNKGSGISVGVVTGNEGLMNFDNNTINSGFQYAFSYNDTTGSNANGLDLNFNNNIVIAPAGNGINIVELPGTSNLSFISNTLATKSDFCLTNANASSVATSIEVRNNSFIGGDIAFKIYDTQGEDYTVVLTDNTSNFAGSNVSLPFLVQLENKGDSSVIMTRNSFTEQGNDPGTPAVQVMYKIPAGQTNSGVNILEYKNNDIVSVTKTIDDFKLQITGDIESLKAEIHDNTSTTKRNGFFAIQDNIGPDVCFDFRRNIAKRMEISVPAGNDFYIKSTDGTQAGFEALNPDIQIFNLSPNLTPANYVKRCSQ